MGSLHSDTFGYYWSSKFKVTEMKYSLVVTFKCFDCVIFIERFEPQNNLLLSLFSRRRNNQKQDKVENFLLPPNCPYSLTHILLADCTSFDVISVMQIILEIQFKKISTFREVD